jgi:hypothetical protein
MATTEKAMTDTLQELIAESVPTVRDVLTYEEAGMLTRNNGLVVRISDGSEFQITIVKSR